jgi:DNA-binding MarR family transcriptional regulator
VSRANGHERLALSVWLRLLKAHALLLARGPASRPRDADAAAVRRAGAAAPPPEGRTPRELTRELLVTAGNLTGVIARLRRQGFVRREAVPGDRRAVRIRLTPSGRRVMRRAIPRHRRDVRRLLAHVPAARLLRLRELLGDVSRGLEPRA